MIDSRSETSARAAQAVQVVRGASPAARDIFRVIVTRGPIARANIGRQTGLSLAAVTKAVGPLIDAGLVAEGAPAPSVSAGRPIQPLSIVADALVFVGIKVNPEEIIAVVTTIQAETIASVHRRIADSSVETVLAACEDAARALTAQLGDRADRITGIGIAVSGDVDEQNGMVRHSARLGWEDVPLRRLLEDRLSVPVHVDNDVRALTIAEEWFGEGIDARSFAIVTIGSGIGCGLYLNGDVVSGARSVAGEIGHLPLASSDDVCSCGRRGCVETVASTPSILREMRRRTGEADLTIDDAVDRARAGDREASDVFGRAGAVLGTAIAVVVNLVGPELVLVMGEASPDYDVYEQPLRASFEAHAFGAAGDCRIITRAHRFEDWARGAAASTIRALVSVRQPADLR